MRLILSILVFTAAGFVGLVCAEAAAEAPGAAACRACHADVAAGGYPHFQDAAGEAKSCTSCHINAEGHPGSAGEPSQSIMSFRSESAADRSAVCASCHQDQHSGTGLTAHGSAAVACSDCHRAHERAHGEDGMSAPMPAGFDRIDAASATCVSCHEGVFSRFAFNERHRLAEGSVSCVSCHDPHADVSAKLGGFADHTCAGCHAQTAGPFVFEHAASRVEGCAACHEPHGGPNRFLLTYQQEGELCYSCHAMVPQFHTGFGPGGPPRFGPDTVCTACHASIHGSNFDRNFLR